MIFDPANPNVISLDEAARLIQDGWLAQFRGRGWLSSLIQFATGGVHSHSAMLQRVNGHVDCLEVREWIGGRRKPLEHHVGRWPGQIDVFSPDRNRFGEFKKHEAVKIMRQMLVGDYGYAGALRLALHKVPLLWRLWPLETRDDDPAGMKIVPFCSHAVCAACRIGGGIDPVPNKPDHLVTPADLTNSLLFRYEFTLGKERG